MTNTQENAEYYVPSNFKSIEYHQTTTKCPSKSKIRKNLNLVCPKCPSPSYEQNGHTHLKVPLIQSVGEPKDQEKSARKSRF